MVIVYEENFDMTPKHVSNRNDPLSRWRAERAMIDTEIGHLQSRLDNHRRSADTPAFNALRKQIDDLEAKGARIDEYINRCVTSQSAAPIARKKVWTKDSRKELRAAARAETAQRIKDNTGPVSDWAAWSDPRTGVR